MKFGGPPKGGGVLTPRTPPPPPLDPLLLIPNTLYRKCMKFVPKKVGRPLLPPPFLRPYPLHPPYLLGARRPARTAAGRPPASWSRRPGERWARSRRPGERWARSGRPVTSTVRAGEQRRPVNSAREEVRGPVREM